MKIAATVAFVVFLTIPSIGQDSLKTKWVLSLDFGLQAHDKRLFTFSSLLAMQPETFGTYQLKISIARKIFDKERLEIFAGIGLSSELSTFLRPFDHRYRKEFGTDILTFTDRYYQYLMQFPIKSKYRLSRRFGFSLDILPQLNFLTVANLIGSRRRYSWWRFSFYSVEVNPGIEYSTSRFDFGLKGRIFQIKKIDRILFNETINSFGDPDPRNDKTFETFNPFKLWFSVGYKF